MSSTTRSARLRARMTALVRRRGGVTLAAALVLGLGVAGVGVASSGAWFTASASSAATVTGATLSIGEVGVTRDATTISVANVFPMTDSQSSTLAPAQWVTVRNTGTIPLTWTISLANPQAVAPLTSAQLAGFKYRLLAADGSALSPIGIFSQLPAAASSTSALYTGPEIPAGGEYRLQLSAWLAPESGDEFQGASAKIDIVINAMQSGAPQASSLLPVTATATKAGSPAGSATKVDWSAAVSSAGAITPSDVTYTVERSETPDFASPTTVYTGQDRSVVDTTGRAVGSATDITTSNATYSGSSYVVIGGTLYGWGKLIGGSASAPVAIPGFPSDIVQASAGSAHLCARTSTSRIFCIGENSYGQLGTGAGGANVSSALEIAPTATLSGKQIIDIAAGGRTTCVLTSDGVIACWGDNTYGALGRSISGSYSATPAAVADATGGRPAVLDGGSITGLVAGELNMCAIKTDGLYCWGDASFGQTSGDGRANYVPMRSQLTPSRFPNTSSGVLDTSVGWGSICAVTTSHQLFCAGFNANGQIGSTSTGSQSRGLPTQLVPGRFDRVTAGQAHTCAAGDAGLVCFGWGASGQLGTGDNQNTSPTPRTVDVGFASGTVAALSAGYDTTCALSTSGEVRCWGDNGSRRATGAPSPAYVLAPTAVSGLDALGCAGGSVASGATCSLEPSRTYYYRVTYTVTGNSVIAPAGVATRA
ncbi:hypothetical protein ACFSBZ_09585 [Amnibacterium flavum]|uniref:RCC1-like domain-containing protein n=1 Tax=Amnibacterium flavum TaxID=2173173 RepID=A0A2V1HRD6_9MICO|nr:hypothetical protein [Amnibacterium flavum]PVZ95108.1 hypothetical protein DDQ50_00825 [Amnibacterium flavum]